MEDLKKLQENGASVAQVRKAYAMMEANKERRAKATEKLLTLDWKKVSLEEVKDLLSQGADIKAKEIRSVDADRSGQPVDHSLRRVLFGGDRLRQNAPLSLIVAERLKERQSRS